MTAIVNVTATATATLNRQGLKCISWASVEWGFNHALSINAEIYVNFIDSFSFGETLKLPSVLK